MAKEFKTSSQLIELLESRGVLTDAAALDCLRREMNICSLEHYRILWRLCGSHFKLSSSFCL